MALVAVAVVPFLFTRSAASSRSADSPRLPPSANTESSVVAPKQPITVLARIKSNGSRFLDSLAAQRGLRKLALLETGMPMTSSAAGTSFYVLCTSLARFRSDTLQLDGTAERSQEFRSHFSVHHLIDDEYVLVAFASIEGASRAAGSADKGAEVTLFSLPFEQADTPVLIPSARVRSASTRRLSNGVDVIDVQTTPHIGSGRGL